MSTNQETLTIQIIARDTGFDVAEVPFGDLALKEDLQWILRKYTQRQAQQRRTPLVERTLQAIIALWHLDVAKGREPNLKVGRVATAVNTLDTHLDGRGLTPVTARKVGGVARRDLGLETRRSSTYTRAFEIVPNRERLNTLRKRFGLEKDYVLSLVEALKRSNVTDFGTS